MEVSCLSIHAMIVDYIVMSPIDRKRIHEATMMMIKDPRDASCWRGAGKHSFETIRKRPLRPQGVVVLMKSKVSKGCKEFMDTLTSPRPYILRW